MIRNVGEDDHEFLLATTEENLKHAEDMQKLAESREFEATKLLTQEATADAVIAAIRPDPCLVAMMLANTETVHYDVERRVLMFGVTRTGS